MQFVNVVKPPPIRIPSGGSPLPNCAQGRELCVFSTDKVRADTGADPLSCKSPPGLVSPALSPQKKAAFILYLQPLLIFCLSALALQRMLNA